jgi:hypothetical protein
VKRISSRWTFFYKRVFPVFWFGIIGVIFLTGLKTGSDTESGIMFLVIPILMTVLGYLMMKQMIFDLVDEAWDAGDYLIFKNKDVEETVRLDNIMNVGGSVLVNPQRVTLTLRTPGRLGKEITFSPPASINPFKKSPIVDELIQRVDAARNR